LVRTRASGDKSLEDRPRSGRASIVDPQELRVALEEQLGIVSYPRTFFNGLSTVIYFTCKRPREDPRELTDAQAQRGVDICTTLFQNPTDDRFWHRVVTCNIT
jgi:hypothetical protein